MGDGSGKNGFVAIEKWSPPTCVAGGLWNVYEDGRQCASIVAFLGQLSGMLFDELALYFVGH